MKKKNIFIILLSVLVIACSIFSIYYILKSKGENKQVRSIPGDNIYNLHCEKITISVDDVVMVELEGEQKEKLLEYFNNNAFYDEYNVDEEIDDTYNITVDFNNKITKLYMRKSDNYVYYYKSGENNFRYELKEEVHDEIMRLIGYDKIN